MFITGKCDSYIKIKLLPDEKFADIKAPKTHVQKETLFPLFDETFNMLVKELIINQNYLIIYNMVFS